MQISWQRGGGFGKGGCGASDFAPGRAVHRFLGMIRYD